MGTGYLHGEQTDVLVDKHRVSEFLSLKRLFQRVSLMLLICFVVN
jgi:hypothetical protein